MNKIKIFITAILFFFLIITPAISKEDTFKTRLTEGVKEFTLKNGLKVLIFERHDAPIVAFRIVYKVGSVNEHEGITGTAHLLEHLAFSGTKKIGTKNYKKESKLLQKQLDLYRKIEKEQNKEKLINLIKEFKIISEQANQLIIPDELGEIYKRNGAVGLNASTGKDFTIYKVSLPANKLELWAELESDRMSNSVIQRGFFKERKIVSEERELRVTNNPQGQTFERLLLTAFEAHPYRLPPVGFKHDIINASPDTVLNFHKTYYVPNNTVISIVGDVNTSETIKLIKEKFGRIPRGDAPPEVYSVEPPQEGEKRRVVRFASEPLLLMAFKKPPIKHRNDYVFDLISMILGDGRTSRLNKSLVQKKRIAISASASSGAPGALYTNLFFINAIPKRPFTNKDVEAAITEELELMKKELVSERELKKVLNNMEAHFIRSLNSNSGLAAKLAFLQAATGDWKYILEAQKIWKSITPEEIKFVANEYFKSDNRTVVTLEKK